ncbi:ABC transporter permease [Vallitalea sediminicola]
MNKKKHFGIKLDSYLQIIRTLVALSIAIIIAVVIIFMVSDEPLNALNYFFISPFRSLRYFGNIIEMAIPLTFTGLAISIMFQGGQFNLGATGNFWVGGVIAAILAIKLDLPFGINAIVILIFSGICGGLVGFIPGYLKAKFKTNEMVTSLMLNYVVFYLGFFIIRQYFRDSSASDMVSLTFHKSAELIKIIPGTRIHMGLLVAIGVIVLCYLFLYKSKWGYQIRMLGFNKKFAEYSGINTFRTIIYVQVIGGIIAAIGGATEMLGMYDRFVWKEERTYGWDGIMIAILARRNPALVPVAAIFLAYIRVGADIMGRHTNVQSEIVALIQGILILFIAAERFLYAWRNKMIFKKATKEAEGGTTV